RPLGLRLPVGPGAAGRRRRFALHFFFQAEDGIRDRNVTGVQTCALPISTENCAAVLDRMEQFSVVGFVEAIAKIPAHYALFRRTRAALRAGRYDLVILIDYPGYHLRLGGAAAAAGVPVLYYIAPQLWAWGAGRVKRL